uniref:Uncharacterized protein n=1 Tax=Noctiluca scintillans TaxID=2966 RepID=A0A7S1AQZ4_NOCSC
MSTTTVITTEDNGGSPWWVWFIFGWTLCCTCMWLFVYVPVLIWWCQPTRLTAKKLDRYEEGDPQPQSFRMPHQTVPPRPQSMQFSKPRSASYVPMPVSVPHVNMMRPGSYTPLPTRPSASFTPQVMLRPQTLPTSSFSSGSVRPAFAPPTGMRPLMNESVRGY